MSAAKTLKQVSLEMGGKNAIIVLDDADLELGSEGILWSAFGTTGQRCTAASRVIVHRAVLQGFAGRPVSRINKFRLGNGLEATHRYRPGGEPRPAETAFTSWCRKAAKRAARWSPAAKSPRKATWQRAASTSPPCSPTSI